MDPHCGPYRPLQPHTVPYGALDPPQPIDPNRAPIDSCNPASPLQTPPHPDGGADANEAPVLMRPLR